MKQLPFPKRILLKLSGEALQGSWEYGIETEFLDELANKIVTLTQVKKIEIIIVIGWGNIFRWVAGAAQGIDRTAADYMGMLATIINGVALANAIEKAWHPARIMSAIEVPKVAEAFIYKRALKHLREGRIIIAVAGTGNPYFTTDSAAVLRALELHCDYMVKWTKVDGVYDRDPAKYPDAKRYDTVSIDEALSKWLRIMDQSAIALAKDEKLPLFVCRIEDIDQIGSPDIRGTYVYVNE